MTIPTDDLASLWKLVHDAFDNICDAYSSGKFIPILEADVAGYIYHAVVSRSHGDARRIHLDTRLFGGKVNKQYDLVIGDPLSTDELKQLVLERAGATLTADQRKLISQKSTDAFFRPSVKGDLILEFKIFATGFTPQQLSEHYRQAGEDIRKLNAVRQVSPDGRGVVLFDDFGYLTGKRKREVVETCDHDDRNLRVYLFERDVNKRLAWSVLER